jgi:hypothetical protein
MDSQEDVEQALRMGVVYYEEIDWKYLEDRCLKESSKDKFKAVKKSVEYERDKTFRVEKA